MYGSKFWTYAEKNSGETCFISKCSIKELWWSLRYKPLQFCHLNKSNWGSCNSKYDIASTRHKQIHSKTKYHYWYKFRIRDNILRKNICTTILNLWFLTEIYQHHIGANSMLGFKPLKSYKSYFCSLISLQGKPLTAKIFQNFTINLKNASVSSLWELKIFKDSLESPSKIAKNFHQMMPCLA